MRTSRSENDCRDSRLAVPGFVVFLLGTAGCSTPSPGVQGDTTAEIGSGSQQGSTSTEESTQGHETMSSNGVTTSPSAGGASSGTSSTIATTTGDGDEGTTSSGGHESSGGAPSLGCGARKRPPTGPLLGESIVINGQSRGYDVFIPDDYDSSTPLPVVFTYHGAGGEANTDRFQFDTMNEGGRGASIQVAPQGWGSPEWEEVHFVPFALDDSLLVFDEVLDTLAESYCIDLDRVFAMGQSNGGQMAFHLGCLRGDKLRAIMPGAGRCFTAGPGVCDPSNAPSNQQCVGEVMILSVMGADDVTRHSAEEATLDGFRARQGCDDTTEPRDPSPCLRFTGCNPNAEVASCRIPGLAHGQWTDGNQAVFEYMLSL
ncbi:MAG: hypothetical protein KUG77_27235 [Nannocystaceae bacterium]|nr:hypothetical protein [Nannocystaceae bacterium]